MLEGGEPKKMKVFVHGLNGTGLLKEPRACVMYSCNEFNGRMRFHNYCLEFEFHTRPCVQKTKGHFDVYRLAPLRNASSRSDPKKQPVCSVWAMEEED